MLILLVDGKNIDPRKIDYIIQDINDRGETKIFRIYADFSRPGLAEAWEKVILNHPNESVHVPSRKRKQAVDITMCIDATTYIMKEKAPFILCIASGDRDFTHIVRVAHQNHCRVIGYATNKRVSQGLEKYYDEFIHVHDVSEHNKVPGKDVRSKVKNIVKECLERDSKAHASEVSDALLRRDPSYTPKNFGYPTFKRWMMSLGFESFRTVYVCASPGQNRD